MAVQFCRPLARLRHRFELSVDKAAASHRLYDRGDVQAVE